MEQVWQSEYTNATEMVSISVKRRGNLALVSSYSGQNGTFFSAKKKYVWPTALNDTYSKVITKKVWGKDIHV